MSCRLSTTEIRQVESTHLTLTLTLSSINAPGRVFEDKFAEFEISEHDSLAVAVIHDRDNLAEKFCRFRLFETPSGAHVAVQVTMVTREEGVNTR